MFIFDLKKAAIFQALKLEKCLLFRLAKFFKNFFLILFLISFVFFNYGFLTENFSEKAQSRLLAVSIIFLVLAVSCRYKESFFNSKLKNPRLKIRIGEALETPDINLAEFLSFESAKAVWVSMIFAGKQKLAEINSTILAQSVLKNNPKLNFVFFRALLNPQDLQNLFREKNKFLQEKGPGGNFSSDFQGVMIEAFQRAIKRGHQKVEIGDILAALAKNNQIFQQVLTGNNLKAEDIERLVSWLESLESRLTERKKFWERKNLLKRGSLAKQWAAGYTILLDQFSFDVTESMRRQEFREIFAHKGEVETMEGVLSRAGKNNVLIVGNSGSARKSMVESLANRCALGESLADLNYRRVVFLDLPKLLAGTEDLEAAEGVLDRIFTEVTHAGNIVLVIDNLHNYIGIAGGRQAGTVDISGAISSYLASPSFKFIGITTFDGLHSNIEKNSGFLSFFEKIEVAEISEEETMEILEERALRLEGKYRIIVSFPAMRDIISLSAKYIQALPFPEKAMDLLDEAMVYAARRKQKMVLPEDIAKIITSKTQIPVGQVEEKEKEILLDLENLIHKRIINQEEAVKEISSALRRARAEISVRKGPMGCFLFLGPTGVGKTETSKALAEIYFGSEQKMIRLDMSEFQAIKDISRLIGSGKENGLLTTPVRENPFSLLLLDELEKAHPNILNLFLQVLDEGHLTDGLGRKVDFKSTIIIATSNAGYQIILDALKQKSEWQQVRQRLLDFIFEKGIFRPELINRFDGVILFSSLSKENLLDIAGLLFKKLAKNLKEKGIDFIASDSLKEKIVELGYDPVFGARQMQRVIQDKVENIIAQALLSGQIKRGDKATIDSENFTLKINP